MKQFASSRITICVLLAAAVFLCFSPTLRNGFIGYDDPEYVTANPHVTTGVTWTNVAWAFTTAHSSNWHPLTWISHGIDCELFGLSPGRHHLMSLLLHIASTLLLFLWLSAERWKAAAVALLFGLHPTHVESVAWVAERKDVLSTLFWMLTLLAYSAYVRKPGMARYLLVTTVFAAGLLSKPMLVTVPLVLLACDWWPLARKERLTRLVVEKIPLLALSLLTAAAALLAQRQNASVASLDQLPLELRLSNAALSYVRYLAKTAWPVDLAVFYPFPLQGIAAWKVVGALAVLVAISWMAYAVRLRHPWVAMGWCWYLVTLLPVIGIVQVGMQAMADRYLYVPMIGLLIAGIWSCGAYQRAMPAVILLAAAACGALTWRQVHYWKDGVVLFTHALEVTGGNFTAHNNLGVELDRRGQYEEALRHYRESLRIKPGDHNGEENYAQANFAKGDRLYAQGAIRDALASFHEGLKYRPQNALARAHADMGRGVLLAQSGQPEAAAAAFADATRFAPASVEAWYDLGLVRIAQGRHQEALESLDAALRLNPGYGPAHAARAEALYGLARYPEAWTAVAAARAAHAEVDPGLAARLAARVQHSQ